MSMNDDILKVLVSEEELKAKVAELGAQISKDYEGRNLVLVSILKGSVVFMADLLSDNGFPGKKIGYIQKQSITCRLYSPEKKLMFYIQQMHQHFQFIADNLSFVRSQLYGVLPILPHRSQQDGCYLGKIRIVCPHGFGNREGDKLYIRTRIKMISEIIRSMNK